MTTRVLKGILPCDAPDLIGRLSDERSFPAYAPEILRVDAMGDDLHQWTLAFRCGTARWVQRSRSDQGAQRIDFEQVEGDFQQFAGSWTCADTPEGCEAAFELRFRTSVPHLAGAIDSAVGRVLTRCAHQILAGHGGRVRVTSGQHLLWDPVYEHTTERPTDAL